MTDPQPSTPISSRFTLELEFVHCLANPHYLQYLAVTYPHLLNPPTRTQDSSLSQPPNTPNHTNPPSSHNATQPKLPGPSTTDADDTDAACFARYLAYLYSYWRKPEYAKYLTHPKAVLGTLEMLQSERFRRDVIRPDVVGRLLSSASGVARGEGVLEGGEGEMDTALG